MALIALSLVIFQAFMLAIELSNIQIVSFLFWKVFIEPVSITNSLLKLRNLKSSSSTRGNRNEVNFDEFDKEIQEMTAEDIREQETGVNNPNNERYVLKKNKSMLTLSGPKPSKINYWRNRNNALCKKTLANSHSMTNMLLSQNSNQSHQIMIQNIR